MSIVDNKSVGFIAKTATPSLRNCSISLGTKPALANTRSGFRAIIFSRLSGLPPIFSILVTSLGYPAQSLTPTTLSPRPKSNNISASDGTAATIRVGLLVNSCNKPVASVTLIAPAKTVAIRKISTTKKTLFTLILTPSLTRRSVF